MGLNPERIVGEELIDIYRKVEAGERLSSEDGLRLYQTPNLTGVAPPRCTPLKRSLKVAWG